MIDPAQLLSDLQRLLPTLEQDILAYNAGRADLEARLQAEYQAAREANRTAEHFLAWRAALVTQAAAAWVLTCVFVRFLEDNRLLPEPWLAGPGARLQHAKDRATVYFHDHPTLAERDYLLAVFAALETLPAMGELLDRRHNPLWRLPLSADGAKRLLDFIQRIDPASGGLVHDFSDPDWDTRFLGDLYQDLSETARKRYALLQTPAFVESFILDYTLTPALDAFGLAQVRLIDPTCGSGHFLLGGFARLFAAWQQREPATNTRELAQRALGAVHGVDLNPYAVAIARFRLLIAAMAAAGSTRLAQAPDFHFNLAVGDSLLHGQRFEWQGQGIQAGLLDDPISHVLEVEDRPLLARIFGQRYSVVVGNPPYITVKDKALNQAYRDRYPTCHRQYSLGVPFTERFFDLALPAEGNRPAGFVGLITANSFMKREFGKKLIEDYLPGKDLTHVIDTSGAYIPGHGTPTVILFGRNRRPTSDRLRAVLGIRGEPSTPQNAAQGLVWRLIVDLVERPGRGNGFVSVADQPRGLYGSHPWSLGGGGAADLRELIESFCAKTLSRVGADIGFLVITGEDNCLLRPIVSTRPSGITTKPIGDGESVRDWMCQTDQIVLWPYDDFGNDLKGGAVTVHMDFLWPYRVALRNRKAFGIPVETRGLRWWDIREVYKSRLSTPLSITFAFVATHNHFVLDRGGKVFNRSAPVIKLPAGASEAEHLALLGLLNGSTACFWMKQVFYPKSGSGIGRGIQPEGWMDRFEHDGTKLGAFPIPAPDDPKTLHYAQTLDTLAQRLAAQSPAAILAAWTPDRPLAAVLAEAEGRENTLWQRMIAHQEELDWHGYRLYGLTDQDLCLPGTPPGIRLGQRPFEIHLARRLAAGEAETTWFQRHGSVPITEIPADWPAGYRVLTERRLAVLEDNRWIALVEQPEYKRRWNREPWARRRERALRQWLLDVLEARCQEAALITCAQLADRVRHDRGLQQVAALYTGSPDFDPQSLVGELVAVDQVPQMAACRYQAKALPKFRAWQETWDLQRREDAIDARTTLDPSDPTYLSPAEAKALKARELGDIPLPPKYASTDFAKPGYWSLRGKLDVPKERFFSLPGCEKAGDGTLVIGWAGLDHRQRAQAIAAWYLARKERDGWDGARLTPLLVALDELMPWLKQWHNDLDPEYGERMGDYYEAFLLEELRQLGIPRDSLADWRPSAASRRRRRRGS